MSKKQLENRQIETKQRDGFSKETTHSVGETRFIPSRFSVRGLRKHQYVRMNRTPRVVY